MRLPRNHKVFRGQLDAAPIAGVFFLLVIFLVFHSGFVFTPGVSLQLPAAGEFPGITNASTIVAVAANGTCFYENRIISDNELKTKLRTARSTTQPLTLVLMLDRGVNTERTVSLCQIARDAGIDQTLIATRKPTQPIHIESPIPGSSPNPTTPSTTPP